MTNTTISATELAENLPDVLERLRRGGETFIVELDGEVVAELGPRTIEKSITLHEFLDRLLELGEPDPDFADDVRAGIAAQGSVRYVDWPT